MGCKSFFSTNKRTIFLIGNFCFVKCVVSISNALSFRRYFFQRALQAILLFPRAWTLVAYPPPPHPPIPKRNSAYGIFFFFFFGETTLMGVNGPFELKGKRVELAQN